MQQFNLLNLLRDSGKNKLEELGFEQFFNFIINDNYNDD